MFGSIGSALGISADAAFGGITSAAGELYKNQEAKRAAKRQMEFQAQMSNTGYQRAMADMKAAGLNPILAGKLGPASSPGGAMYQPGNIGQAFVQGVQGVSSAQQALGSAAVSGVQVDKIEAETDKIIQDKDIQKVMHDERWPRLFSTMSKENVMASLVAAYYQVPIEEILKGFPEGIGPKKKAALVEMYDEMQAAGSFIQKEAGGALSVARAATRALEDALDRVSTATMEGARRVRNAVKDRWQR